MLEVGQRAPDFTLTDHNRRQITLSGYGGRKYVVLSFHVYTFTDGWRDQVRSFMALSGQFEERNTQVLGISTDPRPTQTAYYLSLGPTLAYPIPLLSDFHPHGEVARLYGLYDEEKGTAKRAVLIVDKEGIVRFSRLYTSLVKAGGTGQPYVESDLDAADILAELDKVLASG